MIERKKIIPITILLVTLIIISSLTYITNKKEKENQQDNKPIIKKEETLEEKFQKHSLYKKENSSRYIDYYNKQPNKDIEDSIIKVNMNLDKNFYEINIPSKNLNENTILVNKYYSVDENYIPNNLEYINTKYARQGMRLVHEARIAFETLSQDAMNEGYRILSMSSYRDYYYQKNLYNRYINNDGKELADKYSARPGSSEHQTGLATDVWNGRIPYTSFEQTKEFTWMQENAHKYGFILRFPKDKVNETGYSYESWHYRYVGKEIAEYIHNNNISYEYYYAKFIDKQK